MTTLILKEAQKKIHQRIEELVSKKDFQEPSGLNSLSNEDIKKISEAVSEVFFKGISGAIKIEADESSSNDVVGDFFALIDDLQWFSDQKEQLAKLKTNLQDFFITNPSFLIEWMHEKGNSLVISIIEQLNYHAFLVITEELKKNSEEFKKEILSIDERNWNIYNWFVNGLIQKSSMNGIADEQDFLLLQEINKIFQDNQEFLVAKEKFLKEANPKPSEMLSCVYGIESSDFYTQIYSILN